MRFLDLYFRGKYEQFTRQCTQGDRVSILKLDLMVEKGE